MIRSAGILRESSEAAWTAWQVSHPMMRAVPEVGASSVWPLGRPKESVVPVVTLDDDASVPSWQVRHEAVVVPEVPCEFNSAESAAACTEWHETQLEVTDVART